MSEHYYKNLSTDELDAVYSRFLINSWSYSKVTSFARNEKAFEMSYIFGIKIKRSSTTIAGEAYHSVLNYYFSSIKDSGYAPTVAEMEQAAFEYIDEVPANAWKLQKTTPTIEDCVAKATSTSTSLIRNFIVEAA